MMYYFCFRTKIYIMRRFFLPLSFVILLLGCKRIEKTLGVSNNDFVIAFGSCNKQDLPNPFWDDVLAQDPDIWIWGGDNIYADTGDMGKMQRMYKKQNDNDGYTLLKSKIPVIGTWDDHDYGLNDGGGEFSMKKESQQLFLDFMGVSKDSGRRKQEGVYASHLYQLDEGKVKIIVLDTRYFRSPLEKDENPKRRYKINKADTATILGGAQWEWLEKELKGSDADFNLIVTSIQFLSREHGFETWGNFPGEVEKLNMLLVESGAKGIMILSGDRHISEFSKTKMEGMQYPLLEFTSSGLTHSYDRFKGEPNAFRVGEVISVPSFGIIGLNLETKEAHLKMLGENGEVYQELKQAY